MPYRRRRQTLAMHRSGLTAGQLRRKAVPASVLSLLGLVRHMAEVERVWFQVVINDEQPARYWQPLPNGGCVNASTAPPKNRSRPYGVSRGERGGAGSGEVRDGAESCGRRGRDRRVGRGGGPVPPRLAGGGL
ncbi:DUF664 domain-containing protein [Actinomadura miaoliensis]|uniref:mycothiol transferase n=1 Tax=Actinomadura miaoliensis TaxID=430685 RepID=UPI0031EC81FC